MASRIDGIISGVQRTISKLEKASVHHIEQAIIQNRLANAATDLRQEHQAEADRAVSIRHKLEDLISV